MAHGSTIKHRDELERMEGSGECTWLLARKALGTECFGYNLVEIGPGGGIPEHTAAGPITVQPLRGRMDVVVNGDRHGVEPGGILSLGPGVPHAVSSEDGAAFLLTVGQPAGQGSGAGG